MVPLVNIMLGEVVFGGVGAGMYGILIYVVLAVFIAGLMVGRTPEYLGKKIEAYDVKMAMLVVLSFRSTFSGSPRHLVGRSGFGTSEHHAISARTVYPNALRVHIRGGQQRLRLRGTERQHALAQHDIAMTMLPGRFIMIMPMLAIAGNLAERSSCPPSPGTFPVTTPMFVVLLIGTIVIVGALTFFPALSLGPILEHY